MAYKAISFRNYIHPRGALPLLSYLSLNLALTLLNKLLLQKVSSWTFPLTTRSDVRLDHC